MGVVLTRSMRLNSPLSRARALEVADSAIDSIDIAAGRPTALVRHLRAVVKVHRAKDERFREEQRACAEQFILGDRCPDPSSAS